MGDDKYESLIAGLSDLRDALLAEKIDQVRVITSTVSTLLSSTPALHVYVCSFACALLSALTHKEHLHPSLSALAAVASCTHEDACNVADSCSSALLVASVSIEKPECVPSNNWHIFKVVVRTRYAQLFGGQPNVRHLGTAASLRSATSIVPKGPIAPCDQVHPSPTARKRRIRSLRSACRDGDMSVGHSVLKRPRLAHCGAGAVADMNTVLLEKTPDDSQAVEWIATSDRVVDWMKTVANGTFNLESRGTQSRHILRVLRALLRFRTRKEDDLQFCSLRAIVLAQARSRCLVDVPLEPLPPSIARLLPSKSSLAAVPPVDVLVLTVEARDYLRGTSLSDPPPHSYVPDVWNLSLALSHAFLMTGPVLRECILRYMPFLIPEAVVEAIRSFVLGNTLTPEAVAAVVDLADLCRRVHPTSPLMWPHLASASVVERLFLSNDIVGAAACTSKPCAPSKTALGYLANYFLSIVPLSPAVDVARQAGQENEENLHGLVACLQLLERRITWLLSRWSADAIQYHEGAPWAHLGTALFAAVSLVSGQIRGYGDRCHAVCECGLVQSSQSRTKTCGRCKGSLKERYVSSFHDEELHVRWEVHAHVLRRSTSVEDRSQTLQLFRDSHMSLIYDPVSGKNAFRGFLSGLCSAHAHLLAAFGDNVTIGGALVPDVEEVTTLPSWLPVRPGTESTWIVTDILKFTRALSVDGVVSSRNYCHNTNVIANSDGLVQFCKFGVLRALDCISTFPDVWCDSCHAINLPRCGGRHPEQTTTVGAIEKIMTSLHITADDLSIAPGPLGKLVHVANSISLAERARTVVSGCMDSTAFTYPKSPWPHDVPYKTISELSCRLYLRHKCRKNFRTHIRQEPGSHSPSGAERKCIRRMLTLLQQDG